MIYDVTNEQSFLGVRTWVQGVKQYAEQNVTMVLIGNKCDLADKRVVDKAAGQRLADEYGIAFFETSAKANMNVQEAFDHLIHRVCERLFSEGGGSSGTAAPSSNPTSGNTVTLTNEATPRKKEGGSCC